MTPHPTQSSPRAQLQPLATLQPSCNTRAWLSTPHPTQPILATACSDKTVRIYSLKNFQEQAKISGGHKRSIRSCCWKANALKGESVLATGSFDASAGIWKKFDLENVQVDRDEVDFTRGAEQGDEDDEWRLEVILDGHDSEIKSLAFCPTAPLLATCSRDKSVWVWEELEDDEQGGEMNFETMAVLQEHEGDVKCVGWHPSESLLASGSYDDTVRLWREDVDDWACCALLKGHGGTVWWVEFEGPEVAKNLVESGQGNEERQRWLEERKHSGSRLITCSDDKTIRVWRRKPKEKKEQTTTPGLMPSIWKNRDFEEHWYEEARLPQLHDRPIYAVNWSRQSGRVVSTGSDGRIIVYEEVWKQGDAEMKDETNESTQHGNALTQWVAIADVENAHDVFEVNHVAWAPRCDKGKKSEKEEVIVSTGDDGEVKLWTID